MSSDLDLPLPRSLTRHGVHSHLQAATGALLEAEEGKQKQDRLSQEDQATGVEGQASLQALGAHSAHPESRSQSGVELGWGREAPPWASRIIRALLTPSPLAGGTLGLFTGPAKTSCRSGWK